MNSTLSAFVDAMPIPVLALDQEGRVIATNMHAIEMLSANRLGMHYITALRQPALLDAIELTLADRTARKARFTTRESAGDIVWKVHIEPCAEFDVTLLSYLDVSPLEQAEQMRRDFVANVSHELRTPLTALLGFIETLRGAAKEDPEARDRFLEIMQKEAGRMSHLVEDLLSLSRVEESERVRPMEDVDMIAVINSACMSLHGVAARQGVELSLDLPEDELRVSGDEVQLGQVMVNLIENGIKYGESGHRVAITLKRLDHDPALRGRGVEITVQDFGEGIAPHHVARLTERFYRVDSHRSREVGGTGLGLAIVKHIVNRHRGRMRVESELGQGTKFTVLLPEG